MVKTHKKDQYSHAHVCKFIAFFFERVYKFNIDDPIVLLFDMSDAGYSNLDMDMIRFVVNCLKTYYPGLIGIYSQSNMYSNIVFIQKKIFIWTNYSSNRRLHDYLSDALHFQRYVFNLTQSSSKPLLVFVLNKIYCIFIVHLKKPLGKSSKIGYHPSPSSLSNLWTKRQSKSSYMKLNCSLTWAARYDFVLIIKDLFLNRIILITVRTKTKQTKIGHVQIRLRQETLP